MSPRAVSCSTVNLDTQVERAIHSSCLWWIVPLRMADEALALLDDPARAATLAAAGRARVLSRFTVDHVCEQLAKGYRALIAATTTVGYDDDE